MQFGFLFDRKLTEITETAIKRFMADRYRAGIAPATINRDLVRISSVLSQALGAGKIDAHPLRAVAPMRGDDDERVRFLSSAEEKRLRAAMRAHDRDRRKRRESATHGQINAGTRAAQRGDPRSFVDHVEPLVLVAINTGMRRGEMFSLTWADVDLCQKTVTVARALRSQARRGGSHSTRKHSTCWKAHNAEPAHLVFPGRTGARMTTSISRGHR